jgi:hypothetical protein
METVRIREFLSVPGITILIYFDGANNIEVSNMRLEWGCGDGLKIKSGSNIKFIYNYVYKLGHDALYCYGMQQC